MSAEPFIYPSHEEAERAIRVFVQVMPSLIVEVAKEIHGTWLDGGTFEKGEAATMKRVERAVAKIFGDES